MYGKMSRWATSLKPCHYSAARRSRVRDCGMNRVPTNMVLTERCTDGGDAEDMITPT